MFLGYCYLVGVLLFFYISTLFHPTFIFSFLSKLGFILILRLVPTSNFLLGRITEDESLQDSKTESRKYRKGIGTKIRIGTSYNKMLRLGKRGRKCRKTPKQKQNQNLL
jgi:hypothetical protein